jgi:hypothetical protein
MQREGLEYCGEPAPRLQTTLPGFDAVERRDLDESRQRFFYIGLGIGSTFRNLRIVNRSRTTDIRTEVPFAAAIPQEFGAQAMDPTLTFRCFGPIFSVAQLRLSQDERGTRHAPKL